MRNRSGVATSLVRQPCKNQTTRLRVLALSIFAAKVSSQFVPSDIIASVEVETIQMEHAQQIKMETFS